MYELFMTSSVEGAEISAACSILDGLCGMPPWETVTRVLYFQGPPRPTGISNQTSIDKPVRRDIGFLWKDLHQSLARQSFVLQARYEVSKETDMGPNAPAADLDSEPGILRWVDFPDPPHGRPLITQRKFVELWEQRHLPSVMRDNNYQFKTEIVEETYRFFREDVEFCLSRQLFVRPFPDYAPMDPKAVSPSSPLERLPSWESLTPVDLQDRWILQVKANVLQDNKPDEIKKAQDQLMGIRGELDGVFDFRTVDRKVYDTRVALQAQGIQALPQKMTLGKT